MFIRITKTVKDKGTLIPAEEVKSFVNDENSDWYYSPFFYGSDALEYFEKNNKSIKGYSGEVWTDTLYWDFDSKGNFEEVLTATSELLNKLYELGLIDGVELYFSGNKGVHILLKTKNKFSPQETAKICHALIVAAGIRAAVFDSVVYNVNRIFRYPNTKHPESRLFKVQLTLDELESLSESDIRKKATAPRYLQIVATPVEADFLKDQFGKLKQISTEINNVVTLDTSKYQNGFNPMDCPPDKRRCIYVLENGYFGPGERENACVRLAAYYRGQGWDRERAFSVIKEALEKRSVIYSGLNNHSDSDLNRILDVVYADSWNGGTYTCKSDTFLSSKCDLGAGPCYLEHQDEVKLKVLTVRGLIDKYLEYSNEALQEYPKTGLKWLDECVRIRPRNFSVLAGANGSGKTSLAIQIIENLNKQKIYNIFFSMDMADSSLFEKLGSRYTPYTQYQIEAAFNIHTRNPKIIKEVAEALEANLPYTIFDFTSTVSSTHIERTIITLKERENNPIPIQVAFVDYAGRLAPEKENEFSASTEHALRANDIAKRTNTHLVYLSQIPREKGDHTASLYTSRVAKLSGAWEENATFVLNCWRPFGDGLKSQDKYMHLYIAKNRSGSLGEQVYTWEGKTGSLKEITEQQFRAYERLCEQEGKDKPTEQFGTYDEGYADLDNPVFVKEEEPQNDGPQDRPVHNRFRPRNTGTRFSVS